MTSNRIKSALLALSAIPAVLLVGVIYSHKIPAPERVPSVVAANDH